MRREYNNSTISNYVGKEGFNYPISDLTI